MRFTNNKPADDVQAPSSPVTLRKSANAPAFRPQLLRSVRMHPLVAGVVAGTIFVGLVGYALMAKPVYLAETVVYLEPTPPKLLADGTAAVFDSTKYDAFVGEQIQLMQRPDVLQAALASLPQEYWAQFGPTPKAAVNDLQANLKIAKVLNSYQVAIDLKGTDAANTAAIVNAIADSYLFAVHKETSTAADQRAQLLAEERQRIVSELQTARTEQAALGAAIGVANPGVEGGNPYDAELAGIRMQLIEARGAHEAAAAQLSSLSGVGPHANGLTAAADEVIGGDPGLSSMKATISQRKASLNGQMAGMTPTNPIYKVNQEEIAELDRTLDSASSELRVKAERRVQEKLRTDLARTGDVEARLNGELSRQILHATSAAPKLQRATEVTADIVRLNTREAAVDDAMRALRMDQNGPGQVRIAMLAAVPSSPEPTKLKLLLLAALPLALLLGGFAAVLARKRDQRIYEALDIGEVLGFPPLAVLPARNDVADRVFEEYVLRLAAGIESAYRTSGARTFLLTAVSLTTDIVPYTTALTRKFGEIGVNAVVATASEMLSGDAVNAADETPDAALVRKSALLREGFVAANMARLKTGHGLVLIESEALLNCGQTEYVARCADATILLVESGVTTRHELYCAAELLERMQVTGIGAVLGELQLRFADAGFRAAIASLDRRLSVHARPARVMSEPVEEAIVSAPLQPLVAEAEEAPLVQNLVYEEPVPEPVVPETVEAPSLHEEVTPEPEEVALPEVAAAIPEVEEVAEEKTERQAPHRRGFGAVAASGPMLVESEAAPLPQVWENFEEEPAIAVANGTMHEKMAPKLSARREVQGSIGDGGMTRKTSWLGRLLGRDDGPRFSIIPDDDDETSEQVPSARMRASSRDAQKNDGYDHPLASRLEQISRQRAIVPSGAYTPSSAKTSRLQIVPDAAFEEYAAPELTPQDFSKTSMYHVVKAQPVSVEPVYEEAAEPSFQPVAYEPEPVALEPAALEPVWEEPVVAVAQAPVTAEPVRKLRRPMSFHELQQTAEVAPVAAAAEERASAHQFIEPEAAVEETIQPIAEPMAELPEIALEHMDIPAAYEPEAAHLVEAAPEPIHVEAMQVDPIQVEPIHTAPIHEEMVWPEPAYLEPEVVEPAYAPLEPVEESGHLDIEPVYQEASRHLSGGRWDPIPPLRSTGNSWRDRLSPVPASNYQPASKSPFGYDAPDPARRRWTGKDEEISRWTADHSEPPAGVATQTEPLPEPVLTRQWGLLSKFQQARASSGARPATTDPAPRDYDENGNGRH